MKNKDKKVYEKALDLYNKGYIDKAIEQCEIGISRNLKDSNLLNLKGLLLYLKGNIEEAVSLWKINKDYNGDNISKSYLIDIEKDFRRKELFEEAEELIRNLNIDEAIEILNTCNESDFNLIGVNNNLAICYMKKGLYDNSKFYIKKVFAVDKNNITAKSINKEINEILDIKDNNKIVFKSIIITFIIFMIVSTGAIVMGKLKNTPLVEEKLLSDNLSASNNIENSNTINESENSSSKDEAKQNNIQDKNNEKIENPLTEGEITSNYINATNLFSQEKYNDAKVLLEKTIIYSEKSHLNDDILFLLASASEKIEKNEEAIKYFEQYIYKYENGNYIEEAYYKIALLYKEINIEKSKFYAQALVNKYQNSIYNNNIIKGILNI
ncbi:tetratricopeptide repeat protein [Clostridium sp. MB05]|uniref:tetratricopeptide repeat protein n=1 Tax=Clostridium sp. MB05 TaxID=3376682 RepID=UPI0039819D10